MCAYAHNTVPMTASERLIACNCFASRKAARLITKMYEDHLSRVDLTSTQFSILVYVDEVEAASMKDLVNDGFVIRTTVFIPAEAVTRQLGKVSGDAVVVTLQKQFSTAICYYGFKAYVGAGLTKIASCTVHQ